MEEQDTSQDLAKDLEQVKMDNDDTCINKSDERIPVLKAPTATSNSIFDNHEMEESKAEGNNENQPEKKLHTEGSDLYLPDCLGNSNENLQQEDNVHAEPKNDNVMEQKEDKAQYSRKDEEQKTTTVLDKEENIVHEQKEDHVHVPEEEKRASGESEENWYPTSYTDRQDSEAESRQHLGFVKNIKGGKEDKKYEGEKGRFQSTENEHVGHPGKFKSGRPRPGVHRPYGQNGNERQFKDNIDKERRRPQNDRVEYNYQYSEDKNSAAHYREKPMEERRYKKGKKKWPWSKDLPDERDKYEYFWRKESVFSQWYSCEFEVDGITYNCTEQYMMHQKAVIMNDMERAEVIIALDDPREMRQQGRYVENFDQKIWDKCCQDVVQRGNMAKFSQNEKLKEQLLKTFPRTLVEASPMDRIWGIGLAKEDHRAWNKQTWRGRNLLGEVLTRVRNNIMEEQGQEVVGRMGGKGPVKETTNKEEQEEGRMGEKGPVKETTKKEEQEEGRMGKGGPVKETMNEGEQKVGRKGGRRGNKGPVQGRDLEDYKSTPV